MEGRNSASPVCDVVNGREIPAGSSDFQLVLHQLHIHETWKEAAGKSVGKGEVGKNEMEIHKKDKCKKDDKNCETRDRTDSFTKLKRFLNINPKPHTPNHSEKHKLGRISPGRTSPNPTSHSPQSPPLHSPLSPALRRAQLQVQEEQGFRERAHSDSSAMNPRRKKAALAVAEQTSPLDNLHVHWPDERDGEQLATYLRPRSFSHGSGERPSRPILKKSSSKTVYY